MLWKCCTQYASTFGKLSNGHRPGKGQFSFQSQRKVMPKNARTTAQLHSSHTLIEQCLKFSKPGFSNTWTVNFQMFKLVLEKAEEQRSNCQHPWIIKKAREFQKNIYFCFTDYDKAFDCVDHNCQEPAQETPPMTRSWGGDLTGKADQDSRDSLDLLEHLPWNQNLSVYCYLYYAFHQLFWH